MEQVHDLIKMHVLLMNMCCKLVKKRPGYKIVTVLLVCRQCHSTVNLHRPRTGAKYWDEHVWMSVRLSARISDKPRVQASRNFLYILSVSVGHGSVFLWWHFNTICTSGLRVTSYTRMYPDRQKDRTITSLMLLDSLAMCAVHVAGCMPGSACELARLAGAPGATLLS